MRSKGRNKIASAMRTVRQYAKGGDVPLPPRAPKAKTPVPLPQPDPRRVAYLDAMAQQPPYDYLATIAPNGIPWQNWRRSTNIEDERTPEHIQMQQQTGDALDISDTVRRLQPGYFAEGGEVEPDPIRSLGGMSDMGAGPEIEQPIEAPRPPVRMEPTLQEAQMGELNLPEGFDRKYLGVNDSNKFVDMRTNQELPDVPLTRRPNVLPLTKTPEGNMELAMPKMVDIVGNMMPGAMAPAVPVKAGEMVLSSGMAKTAKAARPTGTTAEEVEALLKSHSQHQPIDSSGWEKTGPQKGSNPGGTYTDPSTGDNWYVKTPPTADHANNEKLAVELYKLAGVQVPEVKLTTLSGKPAIASKVIKGDPLNTFVTDTGEAVNYGGIKGLQEHFPVDAWLGNYDAIGTGKDNIIIDARGVAHRIDAGGSLRYRAKGKPKTDFGYTVGELETMRDPSINMDAADVFGGSKIEAERAAAQRIADIDPMKISELVERYGPRDTNAKSELLAKLMARKQNIEEYYGIKSGGEAPPSGGAGGSGAKDQFEQRPFTEKDWDPGPFNEPEWQPPTEYPKGMDEPWEPLYPIGTTSEEFKPKLPMSLNKTHDAYETVGSLVNHKPEDVTPKQLANIHASLSKLGPDAVVDALLKHKKSMAKLEPWLPTTMEDAVMDKLIYAQEVEHAKAMQARKSWNSADDGVPDVHGGEGPLSKADFEAGLKEVDWTKYEFPGADKFHPDDFPNVGVEHLTDHGFNPNIKVYKGGHYEKGQYPDELPDVSGKGEPAFFASPKYDWASNYKSWSGGVNEYVARAPKAMEFDWYAHTGLDHYSGDVMQSLLKTAKEKEADLVIIKNMSDIEGHNATQFAFLNPAALRAPTAKFNPEKFHLKVPHLGLVGGGLLSYGALKGQKEDHMNRGGTPKKKAGGGGVDRWVERAAAKNLHSQGMIRSSVPGRTDKLPMSVPAGSYVLPADIPSALGQGNTMAGGEILNKMFTSGPYGLPLGKGRGNRSGGMRMRRRADGGALPPEPAAEAEDHVPIIAAGGEYILHPEVVKELGGGDISAGHKVLDKFVLHTRKQHIDTLRKLKPPKK